MVPFMTLSTKWPAGSRLPAVLVNAFLGHSRNCPVACIVGTAFSILTYKPTMISNFFVLSPRGDTIIAKQYRNDKGNSGAHERSHTEAFFRKIKFWDDASYLTPGGGTKDTSKDKVTTSESEARKKRGDAPPVFMMPDGLTYMHVKRNGLIFGCSTARNCSPVTTIEVSNFCIPTRSFHIFESLIFCIPSSPTTTTIAPLDYCQSLQRLLWYPIGGGDSKKLYSIIRAS